VDPASRLFSMSSFTADDGRWMTSPAAILFTTAGSSLRIAGASSVAAMAADGAHPQAQLLGPRAMQVMACFALQLRVSLPLEGPRTLCVGSRPLRVATSAFYEESIVGGVRPLVIGLAGFRA